MVMDKNNTESLTQFFLILSVLLSNIGNTFIFSDFEKKFKKKFDHPFLKILIIFSLFYLYTKDVRTSFLSAFIIFLIYCILEKDEEICKRLDLETID